MAAELGGEAAATVWITGLPAAGKTTTAAGVVGSLRAAGRPALLIDGDWLRSAVTPHLGFDRSARAENARLACELALAAALAGVHAVVALVSPFAADRRAARARHESRGVPFLEVYLPTPLEQCRRRDPKRLYARAAAGELRGLTGVDDPYQAPLEPDVILDPQLPPADLAARIVGVLQAASAAALGAK